MSQSRETLLQMIRHAQSVNDQYRELFEDCEKSYRAMRPELQALSNRASELLLDDEFRTRVQIWENSEEQKRYKSAVDRIFDEAFPAYGYTLDVLGEDRDEIWADPILSKEFALVTDTLNKFREQHRELGILVKSLTPVK